MRHLAQWCAGAALMFLFSACGGGAGYTAATQEQQPSPSQSFSMLDAYGTWSDLPGRGTIWQPNVPFGWAPYSAGRWIWTDQGWMWNGEEPFAWIVYHYGNWDYLPGPGWFWTPGYEWAPSRVQWDVTGEYAGWAPLPPPGGILPDPSIGGPEHRWTFVPLSDLGREREVNRRVHLLPSGSAFVDHHAPDVRTVERAGGGALPPAHVRTTRVRSGSRELVRPSLQVDRAGVPVTAPAQAPAVPAPTGPTRGNAVALPPAGAPVVPVVPASPAPAARPAPKPKPARRAPAAKPPARPAARDTAAHPAQQAPAKSTR